MDPETTNFTGRNTACIVGENYRKYQDRIRDLEATLAAEREANGKMAEAIDLVLGTTSKTIGGWEVCRLSDFTPVREALAHRIATKEQKDG